MGCVSGGSLLGSMGSAMGAPVSRKKEMIEREEGRKMKGKGGNKGRHYGLACRRRVAEGGCGEAGSDLAAGRRN